MWNRFQYVLQAVTLGAVGITWVKLGDLHRRQTTHEDTIGVHSAIFKLISQRQDEQVALGREILETMTDVTTNRCDGLCNEKFEKLNANLNDLVDQLIAERDEYRKRLNYLEKFVKDHHYSPWR